MKKQVTIIVLLLIPSLIFAQGNGEEYRQKFSGKVVIQSGAYNLQIQGIDGDEVVISSDKKERKVLPEAEGLKLLTPGIQDNTGVGASATIDGDVMLIGIPKSKYINNFKILVPKNIDISVSENGNSYCKWKISNLSGEVETNTSYTELEMTDVSGPIVSHGGYGKIFITYSKLNPNRPNFISAAGSIDVTLPADTKASLKLRSTYEDVFTDFDIKQTEPFNQAISKTDSESSSEKMTKNEGNGLGGQISATSVAKNNLRTAYNYTVSGAARTSWSNKDSNTIYGNINDGGVQLTIMSSYGNIYLRKKK